MAQMLFEVDMVGGAAGQAWKGAVGDIERDYPWDTLNAGDVSPAVAEVARKGWTENAFNEFCTGAAMGQMLTLMTQANVPLDLMGMACAFPTEELLHVELCARMAMRLGGGVPIVYDSDDLVLDIDDSETPLNQCNELIVRLLCVGEAFSLPMLTGAMDSASHPLAKAVLRQIVKDEASHSRLGWLYLDWIADDLAPGERERLARCAESAIDEYREIWENIPEMGADDGISGDPSLLALGWMAPSAYRTLALKTVYSEINDQLAARGIHLRLDGAPQRA